MEKKLKMFRKRTLKMCSKGEFKPKKMKTNGNILTLNDDCFFHIFGYLKFRDIVNAEQTCTRLRNVANSYYRTTKTFEWTKDLPYACASKIFGKFGSFTTSFHSLHLNRVRKHKNNNDGYNHFIDTILDHCRNIKSLTFTECDVGCEWAPIFDSLQYLDHLSLNFTHLRNSNYLRRVSTLKQFQLVGRNSFTPAKFNYFLFNNRHLERITLEDCEILSRGLTYYTLAYLKLKCLSVEVYSGNVKEVEEGYNCDYVEPSELRERFQYLKKLKVTQKSKKLNLNKFLKEISENAPLEELELFKVNVDKNTFPTLKEMKLKTLTFYPRTKFNETTFCEMLVDAMPNLEHLTLVLFDPDRDSDLTDDDILLLIERLKHLKTLNLHHSQCDCDCDYVTCPFRCKLRGLINNINNIFEHSERPSLKLMLPRDISRSFFHGRKKLQKKYREILTNRVHLIKSKELDSPNISTGFTKSFFLDMLESFANDEADTDGSDIESFIESGDDPESHPESDDGSMQSEQSGDEEQSVDDEKSDDDEQSANKELFDYGERSIDEEQSDYGESSVDEEPSDDEEQSDDEKQSDGNE